MQTLLMKEYDESLIYNHMVYLITLHPSLRSIVLFFFIGPMLVLVSRSHCHFDFYKLEWQCFARLQQWNGAVLQFVFRNPEECLVGHKQLYMLCVVLIVSINLYQ